MYQLDPVPFRYIDSISQSQHIALFYDEAEYAQMISFRFIKNGLAQGEQCVYATDEDSGSIVLKMLEYGIPIKYFQMGRLKVYQIQDLCGGREELMHNCKRDLGMLLSTLRSPFRVVSRIVKDVGTMTGISVEMEFEKLVHSNFGEFGGSLICPYDLSRIEPSRKNEWLEELRRNHHAIIHASRFGEGTVVDRQEEICQPGSSSCHP